MKKSIIILLHVGYWVLYFILIMVILGTLYGSQPDVAEAKIENAFSIMFFFALVPSAITFYGFYFCVFSNYLQKRKIGLAVLQGLIIAICSALIGYVFLSNTVTDIDCTPDDEGTWLAMIAFMSFVALISGVIALVMKGFIIWFIEIKLKEELQQKNHEMELNLVKSQLDPHFLFNTLNNIDVLILKDPEKASNYLNGLSDIMRFMLFETKADQITLAKEIEYIEKYIELQKIRTSNPNFVNFTTQGNISNQSIAPLLFIPFIENAFKHTNNKKLENAISIQIKVEDNTVSLLCTNKIDPKINANAASNGLGNQLIEKRLNLLYPEKHELEIDSTNQTYSVHLTISNE